jgi:hypothetical protein
VVVTLPRVAVAGALLALLAGCGGRANGGPLADPFGSGDVAAKDVGQPMSVWWTLRNRGHESATIEHVRLIGKDRWLRVLGVVTLPVGVIGAGGVS